GRPRPPACPFIFAFLHCSGAWPATDARIALIVQRVVRHFMLGHEGPNILLGPAQQRIDFDQAELRIPLNDLGNRPVFGLVATDGAEPSVIAGHFAAKGQDLPIMATLVRAMAIEGSAMLGFVFRDRLGRANELYFNAVALFDALAE